MHRLVNLFLILGIAGAGFVWISRYQSNESLKLELKELGGQFGGLADFDPERIYAIPIKTGKSHRFAWRCYVPVGEISYLRKRFCGNDGGSMITYDDAENIFLFEVDFADKNVIARFAGSDLLRESKDPEAELAQFLNDYWEYFEIDSKLDSSGASADVSESIELLTVTIPESLLPELESRVNPRLYQQVGKKVLKLDFGAFDTISKIKSEEVIATPKKVIVPPESWKANQ